MKTFYEMMVSFVPETTENGTKVYTLTVSESEYRFILRVATAFRKHFHEIKETVRIIKELGWEDRV